MSINLDKVILASPYNSFKNDSVIHTGSITLPTSLTAGQISTTSVDVPLDVSPVFSEFLAYFTEALDLTTYANGTYGNPQWYPGILSASGGVGVWVTAPGGNQGVLTAIVNPIIVGNKITVQAVITNPYSNGITLGALTVPFAFTQYSLAN
jgi:hypothetical protein